MSGIVVRMTTGGLTSRCRALNTCFAIRRTLTCAKASERCPRSSRKIGRALLKTRAASCLPNRASVSGQGQLAPDRRLIDLITRRYDAIVARRHHFSRRPPGSGAKAEAEWHPRCAGRPKRRVGHNLAKRLEEGLHKEAVMRFLTNPVNVPFTNNQAERARRSDDENSSRKSPAASAHLHRLQRISRMVRTTVRNCQKARCGWGVIQSLMRVIPAT